MVSRKIRKKLGTVGNNGINDADYVTVIDGGKRSCPYYLKWASMMRTKGATVCKEWYSFMTFKSWAEVQTYKDGYLNKTLIGDPTHYSPDGCCMLPPKIGRMVDAVVLRTTYNKKTNYPTGVTLVKSIKSKKKFMVQCTTDGIPCTVGYFDNPVDAGKAYRAFKAEHILRKAKEFEPRISTQLVRVAEDLLIQ